jgi:hypothetical protein
MKKILIAAIAASLVAVGAVSAGPAERHWKGYISRSAFYSTHGGDARQVEIFEDRNGCQYLVVTSASSNASAHSVSITPRINSATRQPHCN